MPNKFLFSYMGSGDSSQILVPVKKHLTDKATFLGPLISWSTFHSHMLGACSKRASAFVLHREASHIKTLLCSLNLYFSLWSVSRQCGLLCKKLPVHVLGFAAFLLCWPQRVSLTVFVSVSSCFVNMSLKRKCKPGPWLGISLGAGLLWSSVQQVGKGTELRLLASQLPTKPLEAAQKWHGTDQSAEMEVRRAHIKEEVLGFCLTPVSCPRNNGKLSKLSGICGSQGGSVSWKGV